MTERRAFRISKSVILSPIGEVTLRAAYTAKISCHMYFSNFPFDEQDCEFVIYLDDPRDNKLIWAQKAEKETVPENLVVPGWETQFETVKKEEVEDDELMVRFVFSRVFVTHLMNTFLPSAMIVLCAVMSAFVSSDLVPGRMSLCVTTFLALVSLFSGSSDSFPQTNYIKAMDFWINGCYAIVFLALVEYCLVLFLVQTSKWERKVTTHVNLFGRRRSHRRQSKVSDASDPGIPVWKEVLAGRLEKLTRISLPVAFVIFIIVFSSVPTREWD